MPAPRLILASRSPRRALLLGDAGYRFEQVDPPFDDTGHEPDAPGLTPHELAIELARLKAVSFRDHHRAGAVVLCADTLCVSPNGSVVGKPGSREEAMNIIRTFVNADHDIITAVALLDVAGRITTFADSATATFGLVNDDQICAYLDTEDWRDKAGGYNLFERQDAGWPITVRGDPTTVVGLPMRRLAKALAAVGIVPTPVNTVQPEAR